MRENDNKRRPKIKPKRKPTDGVRPSIPKLGGPPCGGKVSYLNKSEAKKQIGWMLARGAEHQKLSAYRCVLCSNWHVGRLTPGKSRLQSRNCTRKKGYYGKFELPAEEPGE